MDSTTSLGNSAEPVLTRNEWAPIKQTRTAFDWTDYATCERQAKALRPYGVHGYFEISARLKGSPHKQRILENWDTLQTTTDWTDLLEMLQNPGSPGAKHVNIDTTKRVARAVFGAEACRKAETAAKASISVLQPATGKRIRFDRVDALAALPKPLAWTIKGVLLQDSLAALIGAPKCGKSFLALDMALHVAAGKPWNGHRVTQGAVVYLAGEGNANLARRVVASALRHGIDLTDVPLYVSSCTALIDQAPDVELVLMAAKRIAEQINLPVRKFVIDTLARSYSGKSENDSSDMGKFVRGMDALREHSGATVVVVHHSGLAEGAEMRARGSSALLGALDVSMSLVEAKDGLRTLHMTDAKDFEEAAPMGFRLESFELPASWNDEDGNPSTSAVIVPSEINGAAPALSGKHRASFDIATELAEGSDGRVAKRALSQAMAERAVAADRRVRSRIIVQLVERGALLADGNYLIHPGVSADRLHASFDHKPQLN